MLSKVFISILVLHICNAYTIANQTSDCILVRTCPEAIKFVGNGNDSERNKKLTASFCGTEVVNGKTLPKIYCSHFRTTDDRLAFTDENSNDAIESHPNIKLLPESCGKINGDRIIGGRIANLYEFPWMALISHRTRAGPGSRDNLKFKCGGSIINSKYILTAAHCVVDKKLAGVRIGELDLQSKEDCQGEYPYITCEKHIQDIIIEEVIPHADYTRLPVKADIALLRLKKPIDFSFKFGLGVLTMESPRWAGGLVTAGMTITPKPLLTSVRLDLVGDFIATEENCNRLKWKSNENAKPICLPVSQKLRNTVLDNMLATVAGWGITEDGSESPYLLKVDVPIYTPGACSDLYNRNSNTDTTSKKICAGELKKDSCGGDSGGPLMLESEVNNEFKIVQYGIVSYGPSQCGSLFPGVYTRVTSYVKWILDNIKP